MATWEDGPEYAPLVRPSFFDAPAVAPLEEAEAEPSLAAAQPVAPPDSYERAAAQPALAAVGGGQQSSRDPATPYDVQTATVTHSGSGSGAWGATHSSLPPGAPLGAVSAPGFDPRRPFAVASRTAGTAQRPASPGQFAPPSGPPTVAAFPQFGTPAWFSGPAAPVPAPAARVTGQTWLAAVTPAVLIGYGLALLLGWLLPVAPVGYLIGFAASFLIRYRQGPIRTLGAILLGIQVFVAFIGMTLDQADLGSVWSTWNVWAWGCSLVALLGAAWMVRAALAHRERPAR